MNFYNERDPGEPLHLWRVKKEFNVDTIIYPVGVTRIWSEQEIVLFITGLQRDLNISSYSEAVKFFNDHFERVCQ